METGNDEIKQGNDILFAPKDILFTPILQFSGHLLNATCLLKIIESDPDDIIMEYNTNTTNIHSHQVYLNNTASISSISGLPLEFALSLVNSYNFNYNYELDWSDLFRGKNLRLDVHFNPSLHLQFKSFLGVRLEYVERKEAGENEGDKEFDDGVEEVVNKIQNGLELRAKVLTESFVDLKFALQKGSIVDFKINVPRKRVELLDISTRLLLHKVSSTQPAAFSGPAANSAPVASLTSGTIPYPSRPIGQESYEICWPEAVSDTLGLEFCSELNYYNYSSDARLAGFPLSGDFNLRARVYRVDTFSRYELFASNGFSVTNTKSLQSLVLSFNTPGSAIDRKIHASLSLDRANPGLKLRLQCPLGNVELAGKYMAKPNHRAVTLLAHMNGREMLNLEANMMSENSGNTARYEPSLVVFYKSVLFVDIKGHIDYIVGVKYNADLSVKGFTQRPIDISGDLTYASNKTSLNVHMNSDQYGFFELRGTLKQSDHGSFLAKALVNYGSSKSIQQHGGISITFNIYLPNNRHLSGHLVYTSSDTRSDDWRKELTVSLKLNKDDAVELSVLYSRDLRTREELIVTKLAWKHANMNTNGHKMAALENKMADGWKRVEWNVSYRLFEKINMELVLPQYYFHVTLDLNYVGFYEPELCWILWLQLKFAGNEIHSELELGENSLNYEGKWNNYTLSGSSEYSITYK
ncbi:uncharacterized protein LOC108253233, partial [Diaphorina citri]|uniref:Uncharacterized protein LOC108253233 n=1 Tax=Diaphorina citri TaxID=121845 RepID=A0A3Q0J6P1_DIACI